MCQVDKGKGSGNLRLAVKLPEGEDLNEWLAVHGESGWPVWGCINGTTVFPAVDFFNHLNMLYGTVTEFCTPQEVGLPMLSSSTVSIDASHSALLCPLAPGELPNPLGSRNN